MSRTLVMVIQVPFNNKALVSLKAMVKDTEQSLPDKSKIGIAKFLQNQRFFQSRMEIERRLLPRRLKERLDSMAILMSQNGTKRAL